MPLEETLASAVLAQASKRILEKLEKGKKLSTEDILLLYMDMTHAELKELREEIREVKKEIGEEIREVRRGLDGVNRRIDDVNKRIDSVIDKINEVGKRVDDVDKRLNVISEQVRELGERIDEMNKRLSDVDRRIDETYREFSGKTSLMRNEVMQSLERIRGQLVAGVTEISRRVDRLYELLLGERRKERGA